MSLYPESETGEVIKILPDGKARIKIPKRSNCQGCGHKGFCDPFGSEHMVLETENSLQAKKGQLVRVQFAPQSQGKAIAVLYLIPLLALILGAVAGNALNPFGNQDLSASSFSLGFTALSFFGIRIYSRKQADKSPASQPTISRIESPG